MSEPIKVSVILTSYNHAKYLREAIESVLNQTFTDFELIIWDDASTDKSWAIIQSYTDLRIRAFRNKINQRGVSNLNQAISEEAKGKYIAIHHSDDIWEPQKLEKQVNFLDENQHIGAVFSNALAITENGEPFDDKSHFYYSIFDQPNRSRYEWLNYFFYRANSLCHSSVLIRKKCYDDCGLYNYSFALLPDFDMWIRLCLRYEIHVLPEKLVKFRVRTNEMNASGNRLETRVRWQFEFFQILKNYSSIKTSEDFIKVFPNTNEYFGQKGFDIGFALGMVALESNTSNGIKLLGLQLLFEALNDPGRARKINELYRFSHKDFIALTAKYDVFSVELIADLTAQVAEKEQAIQYLTTQVAEKEQSVQALTEQVAEKEHELLIIHQSRAWRVAMLLRRARERLAPRGSWHARLLRKLLPVFLFPLATRLNRRIQEDLSLIRSSGMFDDAWYLANNPDVADAKIDPARHYLLTGAFEGRDPGPNFSSKWYLDTYPDIQKANINPLVHYLRYGKGEGRFPEPQDLSLIRSSGMFDDAWYLANNPDVADAKIDPARHYLLTGAFEGRDPGPNFSSKWYLDTYPDIQKANINPLDHYLRYGKREGRFPGPPREEKKGETLFDNSYSSSGTLAKKNVGYYLHRVPIVWKEQGIKGVFQRAYSKVKGSFLQPMPDPSDYKNIYFQLYNAARGQRGYEYVDISATDLSKEDLPVKLIAFYLPQFHPFPENDEWWGKGFTEWTNVSKAIPNFVGHYQPRLPGELGFYDLRIPDVQRRQVELARKYGIYGFCFHYYWFGGKRLLERPLNQFLENPDLDFPFCVCWANENWTRRWDGAENEILIEQTHSEDEYLAFIRDMIPNFLDKRYIRVNGKPLLIVYRVSLLPNPKQAVGIWRSECTRMGIGDIYLVAAQSFGITDPRPYGFDAAVEFPPHNFWNTQIDQKTVQVTNPYFQGRVFDYNKVVQGMVNQKNPDYTLFRTVMPSWDNTARKQNDGYTYLNSTPSAYKACLAHAISYTKRALPEDRQIVFINAWNEWGEGAYLEPDRLYGYAYLQATADVIAPQKALSTIQSNSNWSILFVSHDAHRYGAQVALLNTIAWLKKHTALTFKVLCLDDGPLVPSFQELADTVVLRELQQNAADEEELSNRLLDFCGGKPDLIYGNTVVSGRVYAWLHKLKTPILTHVNELEMSIQRYAADYMADVLRYSTHYITPSKAVRDNLIKNHSVDPQRITVVYGAVKNEPLDQDISAEEKERKKKRLGLDSHKALIMACGSGMPFRKGADLFIQAAELLRRQGRTDFHFYWIGEFNDNESDPKHGNWAAHRKKILEDGLGDSFTFLGYKSNLNDYLQLADVFLLPSREDPFPLVAVEAAKCGVPIVCFAEAGGTPDLVGEDAGFIVPFENVEAMAEKVVALIQDPGLRTTMGTRAREKFLSDFTIERTIPNILSTCRKVSGKKPKVSIIVPNYNHEKHLAPRLESIFNQTFQDFEVILLDDASTDKSIEVLEKYASRWNINIIRNQNNSGSPFKQWLKGIDIAQSDILWIAESDDVCEPTFLETMLPAFKNPRLKLAYAASQIIDEDGRVIGDYITNKYLQSLSLTKWQAGYQVPAEQEIIEGLGIKNTVLNMSSALFRKIDITPVIQKNMESMNIAGDWYFIIQAIKHGDIRYYSKKLNSHRRHANSVIAQAVSEKRIEKFFQEFSLVQTEIFTNYRLTPEFKIKWEEYLHQLWMDFAPGKSMGDLKQYYPVDEMTALVVRACGPNIVREKA